MRKTITEEQDGEDMIVKINAPDYDVGEWKKSGKIIHKGNGSYALDVERYGGFFTLNSSMGWTMRAINQAVSVIAGEYNGEVIWKIHSI